MIRGSKRLWDEYAWSASRRVGENVREGKKKETKKKRVASLARAQRIRDRSRVSSSAGTLISTHQYEECNESHRAREGTGFLTQKNSTDAAFVETTTARVVVSTNRDDDVARKNFRKRFRDASYFARRRATPRGWVSTLSAKN